MLPKIRVFCLMFFDGIMISLALYLAIILRFEGYFPISLLRPFHFYMMPFSLIFVTAFYFFGIYHRAWRYASIGELIAMVEALAVGALINYFGSFFWDTYHFPLPRSVYLLHCVLTILLIGASRLAWRMICEAGKKKSQPLGLAVRRVLIVGAGDAGMMVARELKSHYHGSVEIVGFVDQDMAKWGLFFNGIPVLGDRHKIFDAVKKYDVQEIIIAIPSVARSVIREIVSVCRLTNAKIKILPGMFDLIDGNVTISKIREVQVEDLLGRDPVKVDLVGISGYIHQQVVLVTGAGGSIGSELCRQIASYKPQKLLILDNCENSVYDIEMELGQLFPQLHLVTLVKDVRENKALTPIFQEYRPQIVFHAAAHKHVPLMEKNPEEALKNNVMGTYFVAAAAKRFGAKKFVMVSTDKAVNPTSFMGASKRLAEMVVQYLNHGSMTGFVAVRFGNVLGSRGSVVPLFKKQIAAGGPVTVTDAQMVRYFMTIPEAVQLVIQAGVMAKGGETFVLDMGEPVKIIDLAKNVIRLSGFEPDKDIEIKVTGVRPGEKLYEELLTAEEGINATNQERIFVAKAQPINIDAIDKKIISRITSGSMPQDQLDALEMIREFLPEFKREAACLKNQLLDMA